MKNVKAKANEQIAMQVSANSIAVNLMLSIFKLIAGLMASSGAMISDAIHSASDVFSTIIVIIGVKISGKASDEDHPYGHDRFECVASIILAILLGVTGVGIGLTGVQKLTAGHYDTLAVPGVLALAAAVISIVVKEIMYWYTRNAAKKINSGALMADAWHHRSDALSSVGSFVGIFGARMGFPMLDPLASVVICLFVVKAHLRIYCLKTCTELIVPGIDVNYLSLTTEIFLVRLCACSRCTLLAAVCSGIGTVCGTASTSCK